MIYVCIGCGRTPEEIEEYIIPADDEHMTPSAYVAAADGTFNPENGHFACTECYLRMGQPAYPFPDRWVAP